MARRMTWKKTDARETAETIAALAAHHFGLPVVPEIDNRESDTRDWEFRCETTAIWTKAGPAQFNVEVSATFAHLFFRFELPRRAAAAGFDNACGRLNRASGKWNNWESPPRTLGNFAGQCEADFELAAVPLDEAPSDEAKAFAHYRKCEAERWTQHRAAFADKSKAREIERRMTLEAIATYRAATGLAHDDHVAFWKLGIPPMLPERVAENLARAEAWIAANG